MQGDRTGQTAVLFLSHRNSIDGAGYDEAASRMNALAAMQPGYRGIDSVRGSDGTGITVSWWADEASAIAWRNQADHAAVRGAGKAQWYDRFEVAVAAVGRSYRWERP